MQCIDTRYGLNEVLTVRFAHYRNAQTAIALMTAANDLWLMATVAVTGTIPAGCVAIKHWLENDGVPGLLADAGVIEGRPLYQIQRWYAAIPVYRLMPAALTEMRPWWAQ